MEIGIVQNRLADNITSLSVFFPAVHQLGRFFTFPFHSWTFAHLCCSRH